MDQQAFVRDELGLEFDNVGAARDAAVAALPEMAQDNLPDGDTGTFLVTVRDDQDKPLLGARMEFSVVWVA